MNLGQKLEQNRKNNMVIIEKDEEFHRQECIIEAEIWFSKKEREIERIINRGKDYFNFKDLLDNKQYPNKNYSSDAFKKIFEKNFQPWCKKHGLNAEFDRHDELSPVLIWEWDTVLEITSKK